MRILSKIEVKKIVLFLAVIVVLLLPQLSKSQEPTGTCTFPDATIQSGWTYSDCTDNQGSWAADSGTSSSTSSSTGILKPLVPSCINGCGWNDLMALVNNVINFFLFAMAVPIAAIMFAYAGVLMITAGGSTERWGKAKKIFTSVAFGVIVAVAAWLIIHLVFTILNYPGSWIGL